MSKRRQITWNTKDLGSFVDKALPPPAYVFVDEPKELAEQFSVGCMCVASSQLEGASQSPYDRKHELGYLVPSNIPASQIHWYTTTTFFPAGTPAIFLGTARVVERQGRIDITVPRPVFLINGQRWMTRTFALFTPTESNFQL